MQFNRYKPKISTVILMFILALSMMILSSTLTVHAADGVPSAAQIVDGIGKSGAGGTGRIPGGINYQRTGYLCYLLTKDGQSISGMQAKAFHSPGFAELSGSDWYCHSKKGGYSASQWSGEAKWGCSPFNKDDTTNVEQIKSWLYEKVGDKENGVQFVYDNWGEAMATEFTKGDYILVIENILHFQPCIKESSSGKIDFRAETKKQLQASLIAYGMTNHKLTRKEAEIEAGDKIAQMDKTGILDEIVADVRELYINKYGTDEKGATYKSVGGAVIGTCTDCIEYQHKVGADAAQFRSYTNGVSCLAEYIEPKGAGEEAGFIAYTGAMGRDKRWSDSEVKQYGISMIVISAKTQEVIHTYASEEGSPGAPQNNDPPRFGEYDIVKCYRTYNETTGEYTDDGTTSRTSCINRVSVDEEPEYKIIQWDTSSSTNTGMSSLSYNPPAIQHGETSKVVELEKTEGEKCIYVLLERRISEEVEEEDYNYLLPQSRITRRIWLSTPDNPLPEKIDTHEFIWSIEEHIHECAGHYCDGLNSFHSCDGHEKEISETETITEHCPTGCKDEAHDDYCDERSGVSPWKFMERNLKLSIYNTEKENYPDIVSSKKEWIENTGEVKPVNGLMKSFYDHGSFDRGDSEYDYTAKEYKETGWDYICVIHRGQDDLTLLEYKNDLLGASDANTELADVSPKSYQVSNTDSGTRKTGDYYEAFNAVFELDTKTPGVDNETTFGPVDRSPHVGGICAYDLKKVILDPLSINDIKVKVEVYSGLASGGQNDITPGLPERGNESYNYKGTTYDKGRRVKIETGGSVSFRPYIQMQYDTILNIDKKSYVIGEYQRSITTNDYAEIGYNSGTGGILTLSSLQWSTHKSSQGNGKVLPGGAALSLSIDTGNHRFVRISTFQCFIDGAGKEQIDKIGGDYSALQTQSEAKGSHDSLVASVKAAIEVLNVQQWVNRNGGDPFGGIPVDNYENTDISALDNNAKDGKVSMDAKYYFSNDGGNTLAGEGDLDVEIAGQDSEIVYTFFTNTKGEVRVVKDDVNAPLANEDAGTVLCTITKDMENWDYGNKFTGGSNLTADAAYINQRTNVVDKLIKGVEAGTGRDTGIGMTNAPGWRNPEWYNEAFDGISVVVNSTVLEVGYKYPSERQIVLDPKLIPYQKNQASMATNLTFTSGFKTKPYSPAYKSVPGQIGTFRGARIDLADMDTFFKTSESFHILNQTTQDLH